MSSFFKRNKIVFSSGMFLAASIIFGLLWQMQSGKHTALAASITTGIVTANVSIKLEGIGNGSGENHTPQHTTRTIFISLYDPTTKQLYGNADTVTYDGNNFFTNPSFSLGQVPSGTYTVYVKATQHLTASLPQSDAVLNGMAGDIHNIMLRAGDIASVCTGDNCVDTHDQQMMQACMTQANSCTTACPNRFIADLNDDGVVDATDQALLQNNMNTCGNSISTSSKIVCSPNPTCKGFNVCSLNCGKQTITVTPSSQNATQTPTPVTTGQ